MLNELLDESNYYHACDASVSQIVRCYFSLNQKYISEYVRHESVCKVDFYTGLVILRHVFRVVLSSTMNLELTEDMHHHNVLHRVCEPNTVEQVRRAHLYPAVRRRRRLTPAVFNDEERGTYSTYKRPLYDSEHTPRTCRLGVQLWSVLLQAHLRLRHNTRHHLFVYNKTLSNLSRHFVKSNQGIEETDEMRLLHADVHARVSSFSRRCTPHPAHRMRPTASCRMQPDIHVCGTEMTATEKRLQRSAKKLQICSKHVYLPIYGVSTCNICLFCSSTSRCTLRVCKVYKWWFASSAILQRYSTSGRRRTAMATVTSAEFMYNVHSLAPRVS